MTGAVFCRCIIKCKRQKFLEFCCSFISYILMPPCKRDGNGPDSQIRQDTRCLQLVVHYKISSKQMYMELMGSKYRVDRLLHLDCLCVVPDIGLVNLSEYVPNMDVIFEL